MYLARLNNPKTHGQKLLKDQLGFSLSSFKSGTRYEPLQYSGLSLKGGVSPIKQSSSQPFNSRTKRGGNRKEKKPNGPSFIELGLHKLPMLNIVFYLVMSGKWSATEQY